MKCWISSFNAQGPRGTIVAQVGPGGAAQEKRRRGWNSGTIKVDGSWVSTPLWMLMYFSAGFCKISPCVWPNSGYWCCLFLTLRMSPLSSINLVSFWKILLNSSYNKIKGKNLGPYHLNVNENKERKRASFLRFFWRRHLGSGVANSCCRVALWRNHSNNYLIIKGILEGSKGIKKEKKRQAPSPWSLGASCACRNFCHSVWRGGYWVWRTIIVTQFFSLENRHPQHLGQEENREFYFSKLTIAF